MTTTTLTNHQARARADYLNIALWTFQGWIAMFFIAAGYAKLSEPMENLIVLMQWPAAAGEAFVRGLGVAEIVLAAMVLAPLVSWRFGRPLLLTAAAGLLILESIALARKGEFPITLIIEDPLGNSAIASEKVKVSPLTDEDMARLQTGIMLLEV